MLAVLGATALVAALAGCGGNANSGKATLTYWTFTDYTTGKAGSIQQALIDQFEQDNPDITVELVGKTGSDIVSGVAATAGQPSAPDVITGQLAGGAVLADGGALADLTSYWESASEEYRSQFNSDFVEVLSQDGPLWGVPYTSYSTILYRNLDVLESAGIDPSAGIADWDAWLEQISTVSGDGVFGLASPFVTYWEALSYYGGTPDPSFALADGTSTLDPVAFGDALAFMARTTKYGTPVPTGDQAETDLFTSGKLAFIVSGPWLDPTLQEATRNGLRYDAIPVPGESADKTGGTRGGEFLAVSSGSAHADAAWKFVQFMTDAPQSGTFAMQLGRTVANGVAMSSPEAADVPLLNVTTEAFASAVDESPLMRFIPATAYDALNNAVTAARDGDNPSTVAAEAVDTFNAALAAG